MWSIYLSLLNTGITGVCHHTQLDKLVFKWLASTKFSTTVLKPKNFQNTKMWQVAWGDGPHSKQMCTKTRKKWLPKIIFKWPSKMAQCAKAFAGNQSLIAWPKEVEKTPPQVPPHALSPKIINYLHAMQRRYRWNVNEFCACPGLSSRWFICICKYSQIRGNNLKPEALLVWSTWD